MAMLNYQRVMYTILDAFSVNQTHGDFSESVATHSGNPYIRTTVLVLVLLIIWFVFICCFLSAFMIIVMFNNANPWLKPSPWSQNDLESFFLISPPNRRQKTWTWIGILSNTISLNMISIGFWLDLIGWTSCFSFFRYLFCLFVLLFLCFFFFWLNQETTREKSEGAKVDEEDQHRGSEENEGSRAPWGQEVY